MLKSFSLSITASLCLLAAGAQGQNLFFLPGANSTSGNVSVLSGGSLSALSSTTAGAGAFQVIATPSGNKYYVISNSGSATVTALDAAFSNPRPLGNLNLQATAAAITPNGSRLLVIAGTLHIFDTATDMDLTPTGINPSGQNGSVLFDVAISLDGSRAFVLGRNLSGIGSTLYAINLANNQVVGFVSVPGSATGVSVGPNSFIYVTTLNQVIEVNPNTATPTPGGVIPLNASPGKLTFTPDGRFGLAVNLTPITGSSVIVIDLLGHAVVTPQIPNISVALDRLLVAGNDLVFAYSSQTQNLYQISLFSKTINPLSVPAVPAVPVSAAVLSNEVAGGARATAQFLYFLAGNVVYKYDLSNQTLAGQTTLTAAGVGAIAIAGPANTSGVPATLLQYGINQTLSQGAASAPVVVRVLDAQGLPVSGVPVTFGSTSAGVVVQNSTVVTSTDGFAVTSVTAPNSNGLFTLTAGVPGGQTVNFIFSVGGGVNAGGGSSAQVSIVAGQGQILYESNNTGNTGNGSPLVVSVKDITGAAVANAVVTFSITTGPGSLISGAQGSANGASVQATTDATGQAAVNFLSTQINPGSGYQQTSITANAPGTNTVNFFVTTTTQQPSGITAGFVKPQNGDPMITGQAGTIIRGAVIASAGSIRGPVPNVGVRIVNSDLNGNFLTDPSQGPFLSCADPTGSGTVSDMTGLITCDVVLGPKVGQGLFQIQVGYFALSRAFSFTVTPGQPASIRIASGNNQSGMPGQTLPVPLGFQVLDAGGNPLSGQTVTYAVAPFGAVTLVNPVLTTDSNGNASARATLGNIAGPATIRVTSGSATATFTVNVNIPIGGVQPVSGGSQTALAGAPFAAPLVVKVTDANGSPVSGAQVTFSVSAGSASLGSSTATTNASGLASTTVNAGTNVGPITVTASSSGFSTTFALTSLRPGPTNVTFVNGAGFQTQPGFAPGSIVTINGTGIAGGVQGTVTPGTLVGSLPTSLAGVQVLFNGIAAPIYSVSNLNGKESVTVQVPFELQPGTAIVTINAAGGGTANIPNVAVAPYSPGLFESIFDGQKLAVALRQSDGSFISPSNPARGGDIICVFATGLGQVSPATSTNSIGIAGQNVTASIDVGLNNAGVRLVSATTLAGIIGVYQVCLEVPMDTATGPAQPVGLIAHDAAGNPFFAQSAFIPIQ